MCSRLRLLGLVPLLILGLLAPKISALLLHLNPNVTAVVICTGTELVTIHIGADGKPVKVDEVAQAPCLLTDPDALPHPDLARWTRTPASYDVTFAALARDARTQAEIGLLQDLRGPPAQA